jgi:predicted phage terminase large subunit-like protein
MYQQRPTSEKGGMFKRDKWGEVEMPLAQYDRAVHCWDTALEDSDDADYSAYGEMLYANGRFIVSDTDRQQMDFPSLEKAVYAKWHRALERGVYPEAVLIENKGSGISLLQTIGANNADPYFRIECEPGVWVSYRLPIVPMPATVSKEIRALSVVTYQNAGLVSLPAPKQHVMTDGSIDFEASPWVADFIEELAQFPRGKNDDQVDWFVHALTYYTRPVDGVEEEVTVAEDFEDVTLSSELDAADTW